MPVMDGVTFRRTQLQDPEFCRIPVVIASALVPVRELLTTRQLPKPFRIDELLETLSQELCSGKKWAWVKRFTPKKRARAGQMVLSRDEVPRALAALAEPSLAAPWRWVAALCLYTGARSSEAFGAHKSDIDLDNWTRTICRSWDEDEPKDEDRAKSSSFRSCGRTSRQPWLHRGQSGCSPDWTARPTTPHPARARPCRIEFWRTTGRNHQCSRQRGRHPGTIDQPDLLQPLG